jgi:HEAT repeat protein
MSRPQQVQIQTLGALALGQMGRPKGVDLLLELLEGPDDTTRVAAAKSIMVLLAEHRPSAPPVMMAPERKEPTTRPAATMPVADMPALQTAPPKQ